MTDRPQSACQVYFEQLLDRGLAKGEGRGGSGAERGRERDTDRTCVYVSAS